MYIDNRASVAHNADHSSGEEDDEDSYEAQVRRADERDFQMQQTLDGHEDRLRASAPYRVPSSLLKSGAATPSRGEDMEYDLPSRSPTPVPAWQPPLQSDSRAPTPTYMPPPAWQPAQSDPRAPTPGYMPPPQQMGSTRGSTPLFLPGSRGPTPYSGREFTPLILHGMSRMREPSPPPSVEPPRKRRCVESDSDGDDEGDGDDDGDDDQEQDKETLRRHFLRPDKSIPRRIRNFLDMAAEDSDEHGEPEEDEEGEATLSDKEFLDDQPQDDDPVRPPSLPEDRNHDNDLALAAYYESASGKYRQEAQREAGGPATGTSATNITRSEVLGAIARSAAEEGELPVVRGTWVRLRRGNARGQVAFVLTATKLYIIASKKFKEKSRPHMKRKDYPCLVPTPDQLLPFAASFHRALLALTFEGPCPALAEGDRIVVVAGKHKGMNSFIAVLREMWNEQKHRRIEYAKVVPPGYGGVYQIKKEDVGAYVELAHLKRAGLDFCYKFLVNDHVRVVSSILYKGATGRVVDVADDHLTISIPSDSDVVGPTTDSVVSPNTKLFTIGVGHVSRVWYLGDSVRVRWGEHQDRTGVIVASNVGGILEIFDKDRAIVGLGNNMGGEVASMFKVRAADVDPDFDSGNLNAVMAGSSAYTTTTSVSHLQAVEPIESEAKVALMKTGLRYEYLQVYVGGKSPHKGLCGMVVGDHDSPARAARLEKTRRKGKDPWWDQEGILITIREDSTNCRVEDIPIENVYHQLHGFYRAIYSWAEHRPERRPRIEGLFQSNYRRPDRVLHAPALLTSLYGLQVLYQKGPLLHFNYSSRARNPNQKGRLRENGCAYPNSCTNTSMCKWLASSSFQEGSRKRCSRSKVNSATSYCQPPYLSSTRKSKSLG
ncbi:hypothetical protein B0H10DRAFT_2194971 [Mycena sp. CBHHK59/15]|nr:hypothetical protein B0H10DRAFT_2194971 [Mycena sp. CBHHK59/15]